MYHLAKYPSTFFKRLNFVWGCVFPVSIRNKKVKLMKIEVMFLSHDDYVLKLILADQYDEKQLFISNFYVNNSLVDSVPG